MPSLPTTPIPSLHKGSIQLKNTAAAYNFACVYEKKTATVLLE